MLSLLTQSNRLKYFLVDLYIYIYVINVLHKIQVAITYTGIHYNGYLWSSPLGMVNQHHRVWTSHVGLHEQCMAEVDISHQLINIRRGRWARGRTLIWATPTAGSL